MSFLKLRLRFQTVVRPLILGAWFYSQVFNYSWAEELSPKLLFNSRKPSTWRLSAKLLKGSALREKLISALCTPADNKNEAAFSREEAEKLLDDPRAETIYGEKTISIVSPSMIKRHHQQHVDLLSIYLKPEVIAAALQFAHQYSTVLNQAEKNHHVSRYVVVSILQWESNLGKITGDFVAFNTFVSQTYFIDEANKLALRKRNEKKLLGSKKQANRVEIIRERAFKNLVVLARGCKARGIDTLSVKGSWAGALGYPQFMPASLRWAEDGDGDGKIDLFTFDDAIASVAKYLDEHGFSQSPEKAVFGYNHEDAYVKGVLSFAKAIQEQDKEALNNDKDKDDKNGDLKTP